MKRLFLNNKQLVKASWSLSWPMILIMFFIFLIGFADIYVAGKFGLRIQAAYGVANQIYFIFTIIGFALTVGSVSVISRLFTSGNNREFNAAIDSSLIVTVISGGIIGLISLLFSGYIIDAVNIPNDLKASSIGFMRIYSFNILFGYLLLNTNGVLRACKMIKKSLFTMLIVCALNIVLNFVFAFHTPFGFTGIALATLVSTIIGCAVNLFFVKGLNHGSYEFSISLSKRIIDIGWPAGLLQALWQLGAFTLYLILSALPRHNIEVLAAFTNGLKIESAIFLPAFAFNMAGAVVVGNLLGANNKKEAFDAGVVTALIGVVIVTFLSAVVMLNARYIAGFLSNNDIVINESVKYIYISLLAEPVMAWGVILGGGLNGAGDTKSVMMIIALSIWLLRIPLSYILGIYLGMGTVSVWWAMNVSIISQTLFITKRYFSKKWMILA